MTDTVTERMGEEESRARIRETLEGWAQQEEKRGPRTEDRGPRTKEEERTKDRGQDQGQGYHGSKHGERDVSLEGKDDFEEEGDG